MHAIATTINTPDFYEGPHMDPNIQTFVNGGIGFLTGGVGAGIVGKMLNFWRVSGITEKEVAVRLDNLAKDLAESKIAVAKQFYDIRASVSRQLDEVRKSTNDTGKDIQGALRDTVTELKATTLSLASMQAAQDVTNKMLVSGLEACVKRCEVCEHRVADATQATSLQQELLTLLRDSRERHR